MSVDREISRGDFNRKPRPPRLFSACSKNPPRYSILFQKWVSTNRPSISRCAAKNCAASRKTAFSYRNSYINILHSMLHLIFASPILWDRGSFTFNLTRFIISYISQKLYLSPQKIFTPRYIIAHSPTLFLISGKRTIVRFSRDFQRRFSLSRFFRAVESDRLSLLRGIPLFVKSSLFFLVRNNRLSLSAVKILIRCEIREKRRE